METRARTLALTLAGPWYSEEEAIKDSSHQGPRRSSSPPILCWLSGICWGSRRSPVPSGGRGPSGPSDPPLCAPGLRFCSPGWDAFQGACYKHFSTRRSWEEAETQCRMYGSHLASISTPEEQDFINSGLGMGLEGTSSPALSHSLINQSLITSECVN